VLSRVGVSHARSPIAFRSPPFRALARPLFFVLFCLNSISFLVLVYFCPTPPRSPCSSFLADDGFPLFSSRYRSLFSLPSEGRLPQAGSDLMHPFDLESPSAAILLPLISLFQRQVAPNQWKRQTSFFFKRLGQATVCIFSGPSEPLRR